MEFGRPDLLMGLWLLPVLALLLVLGWRRRRQRLRLIAGASERAGSVQLRLGLGWLKASMLVTATALIVVAMARPRWGFDWVDVKRQGIDLVIAVDVSRSMLAEDVKPNRLERAKREIIDLLGLMRGDRVGLVAFAGRAFVQCPVTEDYGAARMFLDYLSPDLIPVQGTDLAGAIRSSLKALDEGSPDGSAGRAIILITDGEDMQGEAMQAAAEAKEKGVRVFAVGVGGTSGAPIPEAGGGFKKDAGGNVVMTRPNERMLSELALSTGGMYVRSVAGDMDLTKLYSEGIGAGVDKTAFKTTREKRWHEQFQWFLAAALLLLFAERLIRDVRHGLPQSASSTALPLLALALSSGAFAGLGSAPVARAADLGAAYDAFAKGDYEGASREFGAAAAAKPEDPELTYNRAVSQYKGGKLAEAAEGFAQAARSKDPELAGRSLFNLGNTQASLGRYDDAVNAYESALALSPQDEDARENLAFVKQLKEQQQEQQKQQQEGDKQDEKQDQQPEQQDQQEEQGQQQKQQQQDSQGEQGQQQQEGQDDPKSGKDAQDPGKEQEQKQEQAGQPKPDDKGQGDKSGEPQPTPDDQGAKPDAQAADKQPAATPDADKNAGKASSGKAVAAKAGDVSDAEAEQILRAVQDQAGRYIYGPSRDDQRGATASPEKDW